MEDPIDPRMKAIEYLINRCESGPGSGQMAETIAALRELGVDDDELTELGVLEDGQLIGA